MSERFVCEHCYAKIEGDKVLRAPSPFDKSELLACPQCKEVNRLGVPCDEPGCWELCCCGTPTPTGYRLTCHLHQPTTATKGD